MVKIIPPNITRPIVGSLGIMSLDFTLWAAAVSNLLPQSGVGSPEGVVDGVQRALYMDETGTTGSILYVKKLADIGGDTKKGWVLV